MMSRFTTWLKKSGIRYSLANGRPFQGQEMIDSLNPLDAVIEHPDYPMARIYREDFWRGFIDTYDVLMGNHYDMNLTGNGRKGVLDLLIFPVISRRLIGFAYANEYHLSILIVIVALLIGYALEILRGLLGISLTLILTPIVAIVHASAYFEKKNLEKKLGGLKIAKKETIFIPPANKSHTINLLNNDNTLRLFILQQGFITLNNKNEFEKNAGKEGAELATELENKEENAPVSAAAQESEKTVPLDLIFYYLVITFSHTYEQRFFAEVNERNSDAIGALLATNTAYILKTLKREELQKLQQWVKNPPEKAARKAFCMGGEKLEKNKSTLTQLFHNPLYEKNLIPLIFDMAGIATAKQEGFAINDNKLKNPTPS